ncbi:hypothetical protein NC653_001402 [Populus alba x Populus x berolinensis]|uniref:Uncharacterized protein n=1 Tax=Populus alba x Populus x berolinensis TaxID=444605 RepID=A0AAD6WFG2_9ROSI|nr:hypothetical protein NC653_001402 [Populus alba x Populus x berolinensis]
MYPTSRSLPPLDFSWLSSLKRNIASPSLEMMAMTRSHKGYRVIQITVKLLKWRFAREKAFKILDN